MHLQYPDASFTAVIPCHKIDHITLPCLTHNVNLLKKEGIRVICSLNGGAVGERSKIEHLDVDILTLRKASRSESRNLGAENVKTNYVIFLDSDVYLRSFDFSKIQLDLKDKKFHTLQGLIVPSVREKNLKNTILLNRYKKYQLLTCYGVRRFSFDACCLVVEREVFLDLGGFDVKYKRCEDLELFFRFVTNGYNEFLISNSVLVEKNLDKSLFDFYFLPVIDSFYSQILWRKHGIDPLLTPKKIRMKSFSLIEFMRVARLLLHKYTAIFLHFWFKLSAKKGDPGNRKNHLFKFKFEKQIFHCNLLLGKIEKLETI